MLRCNNDLDAHACCYYVGVRKQWDAAEALFGATPQAPKRPVLAGPAAPPRRRRSRGE